MTTNNSNASVTDRFRIVEASQTDAPTMATCWFDAFLKVEHPQARFYGQMFPRTSSVHKFFESSLSQQMTREKNAVFLKALDTHPTEDELVGFVKWTPPGNPESFWEDYSADQDGPLCDAFFGAMAENRSRLMGGRPHWFVELMGVNSAYARRGVGAMLIEYGCKLADRDGVEAYADASPVAKPLYERFGFKVMNSITMPEPFDWYVENFMVRPKKA